MVRIFKSIFNIQYNYDKNSRTYPGRFLCLGVGIIDFESWRPIFRQNWNSDEIYKDMSREIVRQKHPQWKENKIEAQVIKKRKSCWHFSVDY